MPMVIVVCIASPWDWNMLPTSLQLVDKSTCLPETRAGIQRRFPARVATNFALVSSASFQRENMADAEDAVAAA